MSKPNQGTVVSVRGSVVDARFPSGVPGLRTALLAGQDQDIVMEVAVQLNSEIVRSVSLTPTAGLAAGAPVLDTGQPLEVPVGERLLGRMFKVFGETTDGQAALEDDGAPA